MTILRSGTSRQYSDNWSKAFGSKGRKPEVATKAKPNKKKAAKSKTGKK